MAEVLHCCDNDLDQQIVKVITLGEAGLTPKSIRVRYTDIMSAALMIGYIFSGRCRWGMKLLSEAEQEAYRIERRAAWLGGSI